QLLDDRVALVHGEKVVAGLDCLRILTLIQVLNRARTMAQSVSLRQFPQAMSSQTAANFCRRDPQQFVRRTGCHHDQPRTPRVPLLQASCICPQLVPDRPNSRTHGGVEIATEEALFRRSRHASLWVGPQPWPQAPHAYAALQFAFDALSRCDPLV